MLEIKRVELIQWRNFGHADASLSGRTFLVGPNASGKSNFLDVFRFLGDIVKTGGGFRAAIDSRGGVSRVRALSARQNPQVSIGVTLQDTVNSDMWRYEVRFGHDQQRRRPVVRGETVTHNGRELLARPDANDEGDPELLTQTHLEQVAQNREFRVVADLFASVRYLHVVPQLIREPERSAGLTDDPFGGDFLDLVARTSKRTRDKRLRQITDALRVAVPQLSKLEIRSEGAGSSHLMGRYEHWRKAGAWQDETDFSDGTLRLIGLLWALLEGGGPLLLEEPELSLHPEVVRRLPQVFARVRSTAGRQLIMSTHSTEMFYDSGIGLDEVLLLVPEHEGTLLTSASSLRDVHELLKSGFSLSEALLPYTRPATVDQLRLFPAR